MLMLNIVIIVLMGLFVLVAEIHARSNALLTVMLLGAERIETRNIGNIDYTIMHLLCKFIGYTSHMNAR